MAGCERLHAEAGTVTGDTILEQVETTYDNANNVLAIAQYHRFHDATGFAKLNGPSGTQPKARVSYSASWNDGIGRNVATADYGTNGGSAFTRPATIPSRSDTVLVNSTVFADSGDVESQTDPSGMVTRFEYDDLGRRTKNIENYVPSTSSSSSSSSSSGCVTSDDTNCSTEFAYNADGKLKTLTAITAGTGNQITTYEYGTTLTDSEVATSTLLRRIKYPDSIGVSDCVEYEYNRQDQAISITDQRGSVRSLDYDKLGRATQDRVTTLGTGVDGAVRRLSATFDVRGLIEFLTSHDDATVGQGNVVNEVQNEYNDFGQLIAQYQAHGGAVNTSTTPKVEYAYADGSTNTVRPTSLTYPNGRELTYSYGTTDGSNDATSRIESVVDDDASSTHLADYQYLGLSTIIEVDYTEPNLRYRLFDPAGSGDIYTSLDRFDRVIDCHWYDDGALNSAARIKYGYDRASNRVWREDVVADAAGKHFDELYDYDGLHRLKDMQRGSLNANKDAITNLQFEQCWSLDAVGNWDNFRSDDTGSGSWDLNQLRTSNEVNEITDITESAGPSWVTPAYDPAGNMTIIPQPADPTSSFTATYDAWNRLVKLADGSNTVQKIEYDPRTYRTIHKDYSGGSLSETRHFYYSAGWRLLEERTGTSTDPSSQIIWGLRYIDDLILRDKDTTDNGEMDERLYALQDGNWNVIAISDNNGDVQERYLYSAYGFTFFLSGNWASQSSSPAAWNRLYAGYLQDSLTLLYNIRNRTYHSQIGIWTSRDPKLYIDSLNLYSYTLNAPISHVDPYGTSSVCGIGSDAIYVEFGKFISFPILPWWYIIGMFGGTLGASFGAIINCRAKDWATFVTGFYGWGPYVGLPAAYGGYGGVGAVWNLPKTSDFSGWSYSAVVSGGSPGIGFGGYGQVFSSLRSDLSPARPGPMVGKAHGFEIGVTWGVSTSVASITYNSQKFILGGGAPLKKGGIIERLVCCKGKAGAAPAPGAAGPALKKLPAGHIRTALRPAVKSQEGKLRIAAEQEFTRLYAKNHSVTPKGWRTTAEWI